MDDYATHLECTRLGETTLLMARYSDCLVSPLGGMEFMNFCTIAFDFDCKIANYCDR